MFKNKSTDQNYYDILFIMKTLLKSLFAGVFVPIAFASTIFNTASSLSKADLPQANRPYVIQIYDWKGEKLDEVSGRSQSLDPFLISKELGVKPNTEDKFSVFPDIKLGIGGQITIFQAPTFQVLDGKKKISVRSWSKTVGDLLKEKNIESGQDDKINFAVDTELEEGMEIKINRVAKTTVVVPEAITYKTIKKQNPNLEKGNRNIITKGANGTKNKYYLVTREDGEEISRVLQKTEIVAQPIDEAVEVGTKVVVYSTGKATWYVRDSSMIAAHNSLPRGTKVNVVNLNNGKSIAVTIAGGGIYHDDNVVIDLSTAAFEALGASLGTGKLNNIRVEKYYPPE